MLVQKGWSEDLGPESLDRGNARTVLSEDPVGHRAN